MAVNRKITDYFDTKPQFKKRVKSHAERGQIENIFVRFPHLSEEIFGLLDYKTLATCNQINRNWFATLNNQRIYWMLMIQKSTCEKFTKEWMLAVNKAPFENLKKLAELAQKYSHKVSDKRYFSLLHTVANAGEIELFQFIVNKIGYKHFSDENVRESTPLQIAASKGNFDICKFIIDQVDDKNPQNKYGWTPFHYATLNGQFEICQLIFNFIGHKQPKDYNGVTPFHIAARLGNLEICQMIIDKIEVKNPGKNNGSTPLHEAAKKGYLDIFKLIFEKIEAKNPRNQDGITPLHNAAKHGHLEICKLIFQSTLEVKNPVDNRGATPIDLALASSVKNKQRQEAALYEKDLKVIYFLIGENNLQN